MTLSKKISQNFKGFDGFDNSLSGDSDSNEPMRGTAMVVQMDCTLPDSIELSRGPGRAKDLEVKVCIPVDCVLEVRLDYCSFRSDSQSHSNDGGAVPYDCNQQ